MGERMRIAVGAALLAGIAGAALAQDMDAPPPGPPPGAMRGGGMAQMLQARFAAMDTNHDGVVTRAEYDAWRAERRARMQARGGDRPGPRGGGGMGRGGDLFDRADLNHDGRVTMAEAQTAAQAMMTGGEMRGMRGPGGRRPAGDATGPGYEASVGGAPGYDPGDAPPPPPRG